MKARKIAQDELNKSLAEQATQLATDELALRDLEERIKSGAKYEDVFDDAMQGASASAKEHAIATKGAAGSTEVFVKKQEEAQTQLQATAKASKAAKIGMKALATVSSTIASALIAKGIELAASALDKYINRAKYAKEAMQEAQEAINSSQEDLKALSETLSKNKDRFLELSQGVDKFSNNKFLSDEDYAEFLSISQEIADVAPDLVAGYDEQGNALLRLGENAKETGEILDDVLEIGKTTANKTLVDNLPDVVKGINYSVKEAKQEINDLETELEHIHSNTSSSGMDILESLQKDGGLVFDGDNYNKYGKKMEKALANAGIDYTIDSNINSKTIILEEKFYAESLEKAQKYFDEQVEMYHKGYSAEELGLKNSIKEKERLINSYYSQINTNLQAWTKENYQYQSLNSTNQTFIDRLIPSLDWNKIIEESGLDSFSSYDYQNYITEKLITPLSTAPDKYKEDINEAISKLLKFKDGDLEIVSFGEQVQKEFDKNNIEIDITPIFSDEKEAYEKLQNSLKNIAGGSKNELSHLKDFTNGFTKEEANRWEQVTLGAKTATEAIVKYQSTLQTDYSSSVEKLDTSISSLTENQELLNTALAEQVENGTISEETIASLKEKYSDLSDVLEITTNGVIINKDKLAELNAEEKKSIDKNLTSTREKLVEQYNANSLAIAGYKMQLEDTNSITDIQKSSLEALLSVKEADQEKTKEQIAQLDLLGVEYDQLTSKTNKFLKSLSTADDGNIYDSVHSALEQVKEVYDEGDYGKDEFRSFVDYMSFDDLSTAPIDEVKDKYEDAMDTAERYFTETNKGLKNFLTDTKKIGMATKDANGNWELNIESVDDLAKKLGISSDAATDILNKFKDKGWEINFTTADDGLVDVEEKLDKLKSKLKELKKERSQLADGESTEELDKQISTVKKGINSIKKEINLSIKTDEAKTRILEIQSQINSLSNTSVNAYVNKEQIEELKAQQEELAKKYNINLDTVLNVDTDKADKNITETKEKSKEDTTFKVDANTKAATDKINGIFNKTYYLNVGVKSATLENAKNKISNFLNGVTGNNTKKGDGEANGTAITGRAYANGKRGKIAAGYSAKSLVGELGPEMRVRDGKYEVLGENGPEFTDVRPDDIIFNAKQTEEILKKGKVNARGNAYNTGANGGGPSLDSHTTSKKKKDEEEEKKKKSNSTDTTKFQEAIDWCAQTIGKLTSVIDKINAKLSLTNSSLKTQIKNYKELLNKQQSLIKGYSKSETVYKKEYNKALKKLSKSDKKKVKDGTYRIEQFSGKAKSGSTPKAEKRYNNIQKALEARDTYLEAQTNTINAKQDFQEYAESLASVRWDKATEQVEKLNNQVSVLDTRMSNVSGYKAKNKVLQEQLDLQKKILTKQENAYENTQSDANAYYKKISSKYKKNKNSDGTIKTKGVTNQTQLKYIKVYNAYVRQLAEGTIELEQAQEDYTAAVQEATKAQFDNVQAEYDNKTNLNRTKQSRIQSQIDLREAYGEQAGTAYYDAMIRYNNSNKKHLEEEATSLQNELNTAVKNGKIEKYSDEWYEMANAIYEVQNSIDEMDKSTAEYQESLRKLADTRFDNLIKQFDRLQSNMEFMGELLDYEELYDDDGNMTDEGIAKLGVLLSNLESKKAESDQIASRKSSLQDLLTQAKAKGTTSLEFEDATYSIEQAEEKLAELNDTAQDSILDYKSLEKTIADYLEEGMQAQIDAYNELIDKKKEALEADQDLYEFQKKMKESTQDIVQLERQLAALEGDDSDEARKKRRELEQQLKEAKESQSDELRDRAIEMEKENLDKQAEQYEKDMKEKIENISENLEEFINTVNTNSANILTVLKAIASQNGYELPKEIEKIFNNEGNAVSNPNSSDASTSSNTQKVNEEIVTSESEKNNKAEAEAIAGVETHQQERDEVIAQEKSLKQTVKEIMEQGTKKKVSDYPKGKKDASFKKLSNLNQYLVKNHSKKLNKTLQVELGKALGISTTTKKVETDAISKKIKNKLKKANIGYAQGGYINTVDLMEVAKTNGDDGWITAKNGEFMLTKVQSDNFLKLAKIAPEFVNATQAMMDNMNLATATPPYISNTAQPQSIDNSVSIQVNGNPDKDALRQMEKIAQNIVDSNQKQIQRMAYNRGMRIR